jgi:hypothetical protein
VKRPERLSREKQTSASNTELLGDEPDRFPWVSDRVLHGCVDPRVLVHVTHVKCSLCMAVYSLSVQRSQKKFSSFGFPNSGMAVSCCVRPRASQLIRATPEPFLQEGEKLVILK